MVAIVLEIGVFVLVFAAVCFAYGIGRRARNASNTTLGLCPIQQYSPPVDAVLEYRNEAGYRSLRRVSILRSLRRPDGRLYLLAFAGKPGKPRTFRVDRILCIATPVGEIVDMLAFLVEELGIPTELCAPQIKPSGQNNALTAQTLRRVGKPAG